MINIDIYPPQYHTHQNAACYQNNPSTVRTIVTFCLTFITPLCLFAQSTQWDSLYNYINDSLIAKQRYDEAFALSTNHLESTATLFGKNHLNFHKTSYQLGQVTYFKKDFKKGVAVLDNSCTILEKTPYKDSVYYGKALNLQGICYKRLNDNDKAEQTYLKAYKALLPLKKDFPREFASCLNNLAVLYFEIGQTDNAIHYNTQALELTPKNSEPYVNRLGTLALLYKRKGRMKEAIFMAQEALNATDKKHQQYPTRLGTLSSLYADMGLFDKAFQLAKTAADIVQQSKGSNASEYAIWLDNLSIINIKLNKYEAALQYALDALHIEESNKEKPERYDYQARVANCYVALGDTAKALPLLMESIPQLAIKRGKKSESYFNALGSLIRLYMQKGETQKAIALNKEELDLVKSAWSDNDDRYITAQMRLIELYNKQGQYAESTKELKNLIQKLNNQILYNVDILDEFSKEQFIATFVKDYEPLLFSHIKNNALQDKELLKMAFETELAMKGIILNSTQLFKQIANKGSKNTLFSDWEQQKEAIAKAYTRHASQKTIDSLNLALTIMEEKLIANTPELQNIQRKTASFNDIKNALKSDNCAIEFVRFRYHNNQIWTDSFYYAALIVKPNQEAPDCVFLCEEQELTTLISSNQNAQQLYATRGKIRTKSVAKNRGNTEGGAVVLPSKTLYNLIWQPLQKHLTDIKTIYYTPAGIMHQVAFAALPVDEVLVLNDLYHLHILSSTRMILHKKDTVKIDNAVLYGGIIYDDKQTPNNTQDAWQYLAGTKKEVYKIAAILNTKNIKNELKEGINATENVFKTLKNDSNTEGVSPTVLHIATHGFFYQNKGDSVQNTPLSFQNAKNPLARSGLIMANANKAVLGKPTNEGEEDGILTAYEISNMNLSATKVVVLSACETGLGDVQGSEGVYGLQRAFKMAGVDYILMSLWKVPDKQTAELMEKFYTFWLNGATIEAAFHKAQQAMKAHYLPYNWAGFVLMR